MISQRKDINEAKLCETAEAIGAITIQMDRLVGFDRILRIGDRTYFVEFKNPEKSWTLTDLEKKVRRRIDNYVPNIYLIVETEQEIIEIIENNKATISYCGNKGDKRNSYRDVLL